MAEAMGKESGWTATEDSWCAQVDAGAFLLAPAEPEYEVMAALMECSEF